MPTHRSGYAPSERRREPGLLGCRRRESRRARSARRIHFGRCAAAEEVEIFRFDPGGRGPQIRATPRGPGAPAMPSSPDRRGAGSSRRARTGWARRGEVANRSPRSVRATLPVLGGIWGRTSTTCRGGRGGTSEGMAGIGIVNNPLARRNLRSPETGLRLRTLLDGEGEVADRGHGRRAGARGGALQGARDRRARCERRRWDRARRPHRLRRGLRRAPLPRWRSSAAVP